MFVPNFHYEAQLYKGETSEECQCLWYELYSLQLKEQNKSWNFMTTEALLYVAQIVKSLALNSQ